MPEKEWTVAFGDFALIVRRTTSKGRMIEFAVVLVAFLSGEWKDITRYDTAHGTPHRDILGAKQGLRFKRWMDDIDFAQAFDYAIHDCTENAENYLADYLVH